MRTVSAGDGCRRRGAACEFLGAKKKKAAWTKKKPSLDHSGPPELLRGSAAPKGLGSARCSASCIPPPASPRLARSWLEL